MRRKAGYSESSGQRGETERQADTETVSSPRSIHWRPLSAYASRRAISSINRPLWHAVHFETLEPDERPEKKERRH